MKKFYLLLLLILVSKISFAQCDPIDPPTDLACYEVAAFDTISCAWVVSGTQPVQPTATNCWDNYQFNTTSCTWVNQGTQPEEPTGLACYLTAVFNTTSCAWYISGDTPQDPILACYEEAVFDTLICAWVVSGTQPVQPTGLACYESAAFNTTSCSWVVSGTQPAQPTGLACYLTAVFNTTSCAWYIIGDMPDYPTNLACYETAEFDNSVFCEWVISGDMPEEPTDLACYEEAEFSDSTCAWVITGDSTNVPSTPLVTVDGSSLVATGVGSYPGVWVDCSTEELLGTPPMETTFTPTFSGLFTFVTFDPQTQCFAIGNCVEFTVGMDQNEQIAVSIFPNPTKGNVVVSIPTNEGSSLSVYDAQGKLVSSVNAIKSGDEVDLSTFVPGVYTFKITLNNTIHIERIIKN